MLSIKRPLTMEFFIKSNNDLKVVKKLSKNFERSFMLSVKISFLV